MPRNEAQHATSYFHYQTRATTASYVFVIGQHTLYDTLTMTSDVTDLTGIDRREGRATPDKLTLRWTADELRNASSAPKCSYVEVQRGNATLQGHRFMIENPKMAEQSINVACLSKRPLRPSTVCCYLAETAAGNNITKPVVETDVPTQRPGTAHNGRKTQKWRNNLHEGALDNTDVVPECALSRQEQEEFRTRAEEQFAECKMQRMIQQLTLELPLTAPTPALRLLTGDDALAATHVGPMAMQVYKRRTVTKFQIRCDGKDSGGKCYNTAPVSLEDGRQECLEAGAKELISSARRIHCEARPKFAYETAPHNFATIHTRAVVHTIPSVFDHEQHMGDDKFPRLNTDHLYTAEVISGLTMEDSTHNQAQQMHEQKILQRQVSRLVRAVDNENIDGRPRASQLEENQAQSNGRLSWVTSKMRASAQRPRRENSAGPEIERRQRNHCP